MNHVKRAIDICGSLRALGRLCEPPVSAEYLRQLAQRWRDRAYVTSRKPHFFTGIETGVDKAIASDPQAAQRARAKGGRVLAEQLCPEFQWRRDGRGNVGLFTPIASPARRRTRTRR